MFAYEFDVKDERLIPQIIKGIKNQLGITVSYTSRQLSSKTFTFFFENELTENQITQINNGIKTLYLQGIETYDPLNLRDLTRQQVEQYIDNNVTDLASAKAFLKKLSILTLYLYKRLMEVQL